VGGVGGLCVGFGGGGGGGGGGAAHKEGFGKLALPSFFSQL